MKAISVLFVLMTLTAYADESNDRASITSMIATINSGATPPSQFVEEGSEGEVLPVLGEEQRPPMSETTAGKFEIRAIRFVTPQVALVDMVKTKYGSVPMVQRVPIFLVVKETKTGWRISAARFIAGR